MRHTAWMRRRWSIAPPWADRDRLARDLRISPLVAQLLFNRGIHEPAAAAAFLDPRPTTLPPPELLPGTIQAAKLIAEKVRKRCPIVIYGDYDVDGITGTAILWHLLKAADADVSYYIPHRLQEGYGVNADALRQIRERGGDTVITVDCGITAIEEAKLARELGLTFIITDHHSIAASIPEADGVVHPAIGDTYPNRDLSGAGVAFKLGWAIACELAGSKRVGPAFEDKLKDAIGLAALGIIADVVPLLGENRVLVHYGLQRLNDCGLPGIKALIETARLTDQKINSEHVGFWLAPRLNAAGRMGHADLAAELLTHADGERATEIALYLETQNRQRQTIERGILREACERIEADNLASDARRAIVVASDKWHAGVIGIVASRIVERFGRPTVLIAMENGQGQGSGRSIRPFQLNEALADCGEHLLAFGGHSMAAGLRIASERLDDFTEAFVARANQRLTAQDLEPTLRIDAEVPLSLVDERLLKELQRVAPFGQGNAKPRLASDWLEVDGEPRTIGKTGEHVTMQLTDGRIHRRAVAFRQHHYLPALQTHRRCRVAFEPVLNTFNGRTSVELHVIDMIFPEA